MDCSYSPKDWCKRLIKVVALSALFGLIGLTTASAAQDQLAALPQPQFDSSAVALKKAKTAHRAKTPIQAAATLKTTPKTTVTQKATEHKIIARAKTTTPALPAPARKSIFRPAKPKPAVNKKAMTPVEFSMFGYVAKLPNTPQSKVAVKPMTPPPPPAPQATPAQPTKRSFFSRFIHPGKTQQAVIKKQPAPVKVHTVTVKTAPAIKAKPAIKTKPATRTAKVVKSTPEFNLPAPAAKMSHSTPKVASIEDSSLAQPSSSQPDVRQVNPAETAHIQKLLAQIKQMNQQTAAFRKTQEAAAAKIKTLQAAQAKAAATASSSYAQDQVDIAQSTLNRITDKRITLDFDDIKTRQLLQIMAQAVNANFVISESVGGSMTIHLKKIRWEEALQVILKSQGLATRKIGNVYVIAPIKELSDNELAELQAAKAIADFSPLESRVVKLRYANAEQIAELLTNANTNNSILSSRGQVTFEKRTNSLWITAPPRDTAIVLKLVDQLDTPVRQVLIEARIVEVQNNFEKEIGARFGLTGASRNTNLSGSLEGGTANAQGIAPAFIPIADRLNFNMPALPDFGTAGSIGLAVAKIGKYFVDLELSALEEEGKVHLISSPRLVTSNQQAAYIETGTEIPYQESTSSGATSVEFKNAVLSLKVVPQITADNRVVLELTVTNDKKGETIPLEGGGSAVSLDTQEEQSTVLVNSGQTIVLGGVYTQDKRNTIQRIPFFGTLPVVGHLFRHHAVVNKHLELLIFLTPHIIDKPSQLA